MKNIVAFAVNKRIYGEANAPTVPLALIQPKAKESTFEGNNSEAYTKNTPHIQFITNLSIANKTISAITCPFN